MSRTGGLLPNVVRCPLPCNPPRYDGKSRGYARGIPHAVALRMEAACVQARRIEPRDGPVIPVDRLGPSVDSYAAQGPQEAGAGPHRIVSGPFQGQKVLLLLCELLVMPPRAEPVVTLHGRRERGGIDFH